MIEAMTAPIEDVNARCVLDAWRLHESELLAFLQHRSGNRDEAEDLLQEVFAKALLQGRAFCSLENPRAWLFQVARNAHVDRFRLAKSNVELPENLAQPVEEQPAIEKLTECLPRVLSEMSDEDREIITMCDMEGMGQQALCRHEGHHASRGKGPHPARPAPPAQFSRREMPGELRRARAGLLPRFPRSLLSPCSPAGLAKHLFAASFVSLTGAMFFAPTRYRMEHRA